MMNRVFIVHFQWDMIMWLCEQYQYWYIWQFRLKHDNLGYWFFIASRICSNTAST